MPAYKNSFRSPAFVEETIHDEDGSVVGVIRVKPSSILWKSSGAHRFHAVPIDKFAAWIASKPARAKLVKK
jgi:hypothetical protein